MSVRKIIHIDMDAFYASVEQRDDPALRGRPVIVGGDPDGRGVVAACSYEARRFGIHSAMPAAHARRLCPHAVFLRPRFDVYRAVSGQIRAIFAEFTDRIEPLSLDEAYLDVTGLERCGGSAVRMARVIKQRIRQVTGLNASAGVSYNKFLAKIASDMDKPDGLYVITPARAADFIDALPIRRFHGIGRATEAKMKALGNHCGADLKRHDREALCRHFGRAGLHYYQIARGIDERPVNSTRRRKSLGSETTLAEDTDDTDAMLAVLAQRGRKVMDMLQERGLAARTLTIKVKYADFRQVTRSRSTEEPFRRYVDIAALLPELLAATEAGARPVRLLGVTASGLQPAPEPRYEAQLDWLQ